MASLSPNEKNYSAEHWTFDKRKILAFKQRTLDAVIIYQLTFKVALYYEYSAGKNNSNVTWKDWVFLEITRCIKEVGIRACLYGLGYPKQPSSRDNFTERQN